MNSAIIVNPAWSNGDQAAPRLIDADISEPVAGLHDLIVEVKAVAVNPVDLKMMRARLPPGGQRVVGWDASGVVRAVGELVEGFQIGDEVYYAGSVMRDGCFSMLHSVDSRLVGHKPRSLDFAESAALPMSSLVSWEALFDRMGLHRSSEAVASDVLVYGAAGGVGTVAVQMAARIAKARVIATASRAESAEHCKRQGAQFVIDHSKPLVDQLAKLGITSVPRILCLVDPAELIERLGEIVSPFGVICCLADSSKPIAVNSLRSKSVSFAWEGMFTRSIFKTPDMASQASILEAVAGYVDKGILRSPVASRVTGINAANLLEQYQRLESGRMIGKLVLER